jgi:deazaflavin-dependent oxidoreductase (nitroreductase family)
VDIGYTGLRIAWGFHRLLDRLTGGRLGSGRMGLRSLWLTTTGRRSGKRRENALYFIEAGADLVVVASNAGRDKPPAWWLNLEAHPETEVRIGKERRQVRARAATADEEARLWPRLDAGFPLYVRYRARTTRHIPLVILEPRTETGSETASP